MSNKIFMFALLALFIVPVKAATISDLSSRDYLTVGDGMLTHDASTGLNWLDLTATVGNSIIDTENSRWFNDFRWATLYEIESVLDAAIMGTGFRSTHSVQTDIDRAQSFVTLFGKTILNNDLYNQSQGVSRGSESTQGFYGLGFVYHTLQAAGVADPLVNCCFNELSYSNNVGSWLVARGSLPAVVPLPAAFWFMGSGLICLLGFQRKKKVAD